MSNRDFIIRNKQKPLTQDYDALRRLGLEYIEDFAHELWTDYNGHDPGITTLEALCYAITDLGYRTSLPIEDILARETDDDTRDFFSAREILPCNPVTFEDLRKKIIDVEGVQNAWVLPWTDGGCADEIAHPAYYIKCEPVQQRFTINSQPPANGDASFEPRNIEGLYHFSLLLEEDPILGDLNIPAVDFELTDKVTGRRKAVIRFTFPIGIEKKYPARSGEISLTERLTSGQVTAFSITNFAVITRQTFDLELTIGAQTIQIPQVAFQMRPVQTGLTMAMIRDDLEAWLKSPVAAVQGEIISKIFQRFAGKVARVEKIIDRVYCMYQRIRNLSEDVISIGIVPSQEIALCADIETQAGADLEVILGKIQFEIDTFLSPPVRFLTLAEMLKRGESPQVIFEGPVLKHGFIPDESLLKSVLFDRIHLSDLYNIIMQIDGVTTVKYLQITNYLHGLAQTEGIPSSSHPSWTLLLGGFFHLNLDKSRSKITFFKGNLPITADRQVGERIYADLKAGTAKPRLNLSLPMENDLPVPNGTPYNLSDYYSVQNEFPATYGTGRHGIPAGAGLQRKTHIRQFKGYLLFFDQLLANYFSQLHNVKNLYSTGKQVTETYFFQPVYDVPIPKDEEHRNFFGTAPLLADFDMPVTVNPALPVDSDDETTYETKWQDFILPPGGLPNPYMKKLSSLVEQPDNTYDRRNRFLDHLLSRFAEDFSSYAAMMYGITGETIESSQKKTGLEIADNKFAFLQKYPVLSYNRAKGQFYKSCPPGITSAVLAIEPEGKLQLEYDAGTTPAPSNGTGLQMRASLLLGMQVPDNAPLILGVFSVQEVVPGQFIFGLVYDDPFKMVSQQQYPTAKDAFEAMERLVTLAMHTDASLLFTTIVSASKHFPEIRLPDSSVYALGNHGYDTVEDAVEAISNIKILLHRDGMKLVDHLLLRPVAGNEIIYIVPNPASLPDGDPKLDSVGFFPLCTELNPDCDCPETDYYSFRVSIILPYWPARFRNMDFRRFAEDTIHRETPAHILPKFCWVSMYDMWRLEEAYHDWFAENSKYKPNMAVLRPKLKKLITVLNTLTNVYPEGHLHDCDNPGTDNPVILGQTILGTF